MSPEDPSANSNTSRDRTQVEMDAGVKAGDRVILNPPVNLLEGSNVRVAAQ
jgi:hypothetical protein